MKHRQDSMPLYSIIIPTHNRPTLLRRAVASALECAGTNGEVIVVDDGSDTPAEEVLSEFSDERLRVLCNPTSLAGGGSPARNKGARSAYGQILFFLDDDDEFCSGYCEEIISGGLQQRATFGFSARLFVSVTKSGKQNTLLEKRKLPNGIIHDGASFKERSFPFSAGFWMSKETYEAIGPMETGLSTNSDTEYCCRLYASGRKAWYSETPGVKVYDLAERPSSEIDNVTMRTKSTDRAAAFRTIAAKHPNFLSRDASAADFVYYRLVKHSVRAGRTRDAILDSRRIGRRRQRLKIYLWIIALVAAKRIGL